MGKIKDFLFGSRRVKIFFNELRHDKVGIFSVIILTIIILGAIFAFLSPYDPNSTDLTMSFQSPSFKHLFGTDELGRDYFTRALYGARVSLTVGLMAMVLSSLIGITIGLVSGYFGGVVDFVLMRILEVITSIPWMVLVTVISIFLKAGLFSIIILIGFFSWMNTARLVRAETLSLKEREYVLYAHASGQNSFAIIFKHILPGIFPIFIVSASLGIAGAIMTESTLSFLGLGIKPPNSSWGSMIQEARNRILSEPYLAILPGLLIFLTIFSINKIGQILRVAVDPKTSNNS